jgi:lipopolysaccharide biosynthesis regulator YciM
MSGQVGDELLEFCFRRVDQELDPRTRKVLRVISLFVSPTPIEAIAAGAQITLTEADDACQDLIDAALVQQDFSGQLNDSVYFMLPVTQRFSYQALRKDAGAEQSIRKALSGWYEAKDVKNPEEQRLVSEIRKGTHEPETVLVEYAESMLATGHFGDAEKFFTQALQRSPNSWRALFGLAEVHKKEGRIGQSLKYYEYAATYVPKKGADRAKVFREWRMALRDSGTADAVRDAAAKFEMALKVSPNDYMARHALGNMYVKTFAYEKAIEAFLPLLQAGVPKTLAMTVPLLKRCYERTDRTLELAELKARYSQYFQE